MQVLGTWSGVLFIPTLKEYIEDEVFRIEIQSINAQGDIKAAVIEQVQTKGLSSQQRDDLISYQAVGKLDTQSCRLLLSYKAISNHGEPILIELTGIVDEQDGTITGQYRQLIQPHSHASFLLKRT